MSVCRNGGGGVCVTEWLSFCMCPLLPSCPVSDGSVTESGPGAEHLVVLSWTRDSCRISAGTQRLVDSMGEPCGRKRRGSVGSVSGYMERERRDSVGKLASVCVCVCDAKGRELSVLPVFQLFVHMCECECMCMCVFISLCVCVSLRVCAPPGPCHSLRAVLHLCRRVHTHWQAAHHYIRQPALV